MLAPPKDGMEVYGLPGYCPELSTRALISIYPYNLSCFSNFISSFQVSLLKRIPFDHKTGKIIT